MRQMSVEEKALERFGYIVRDVAGTYNNLPPYMDQDDLACIGDFLLTRLIVKNGHLPEEDFERYFRKAFENKCNTIISKIHTKGRDPNKEVPILSVGEDDETGSSGSQTMEITDSGWGKVLDPRSGSSPRESNPVELVHSRESLRLFRSSLPADEAKVLDLYTDPPPELHEIVDKSLRDAGKLYHTVLPFYVLHKALGWKSDGYTRTVLKSFQLKYAEFFHLHDLESELKKEADHIFIDGIKTSVSKPNMRKREPKIIKEAKVTVMYLRTVWCNDCCEFIGSVRVQEGVTGDSEVAKLRREHIESHKHYSFSVRTTKEAHHEEVES